MLDYYQRLLNGGLTFLNVVGSDPVNKGLSISRLVFSLVVLHALCFITMLGYFLDDKSFVHRIDLTITILTATSAMLRLITMIIKRNKIKKLIEDMEQFWPLLEGSSSKHQVETKEILASWEFLQKCYRVYIIVLMTMVDIIIFIWKKALVSYVPPVGPSQMYLIINTVSWDLVGLIVPGFDQFFCAILVLLRIQFKIFNNSLESMDYSLKHDKKEYYKHIRRCVLHHHFLLRFAGKINDAFGGCLLAYFQSVLILICLITYRLTLTYTDVFRQVQWLLILPGLFQQLFLFFCLPGENLHSEMENTVDSICASNFYECEDLVMKKALLLMTIRASKETQITAGKVAILNLKSFTQICKAAYSFFAALNNINSER